MSDVERDRVLRRTGEFSDAEFGLVASFIDLVATARDAREAPGDPLTVVQQNIAQAFHVLWSESSKRPSRELVAERLDVSLSTLERWLRTDRAFWPSLRVSRRLVAADGPKLTDSDGEMTDFGGRKPIPRTPRFTGTGGTQ
jgi:hypothetical protein